MNDSVQLFFLSVVVVFVGDALMDVKRAQETWKQDRKDTYSKTVTVIFVLSLLDMTLFYLQPLSCPFKILSIYAHIFVHFLLVKTKPSSYYIVDFVHLSNLRKTWETESKERPRRRASRLLTIAV